MNTLPYIQFKDEVWNHLASLTASRHCETVLRGEWRGVSSNHRHILDVENNKEDVILKYNVLKSAQDSPFMLSGKLHPYAHHLNSSQIMCYNFFRPQLENDGIIKDPLTKLLNSIIRKQSKAGKACFEYIDSDSNESNGKTNYDLYAEIDDTRIFFEIKFTENGFSPCEDNSSHLDKFEKYYKKGMCDSGIFKDDTIIWNRLFRKHYQLIRNAINVGEKAFVVVITDERNRTTNKQIKDFNDNMLIKTAPYYSHLIFITWQELVELAKKNGFSNDHLNEFTEKYLDTKS